MNNYLIITHGKCTDGTLSAYILHNAIRNGPDGKDANIRVYEVFDRNALFPLNNEKYSKVFVVDNFPERKVYDALFEYAKENKVVILDHHSGNKELVDTMATMAEVFFDEGKCGAVLALEYAESFLSFQASPNLKEVTAYVDARDRYVWTLPDAKAVSQTIQQYVRRKGERSHAELFRNIDTYINEWNIEDAKAQGEEEIKEKEIAMKFVSHRARKMKWWVYGTEYIIKVIDTDMFKSDMLNSLLGPGIDFAMCYTLDITTGQIHAHLRSDNTNPNSVDVSKVAEHFNGGGHKNASAFYTTGFRFLKHCK